ncbi:38669_t:CDS:2, partial [Gigaspora margarita]
QVKYEHQERIMNVHFIKIIDSKVSNYKSGRRIRKGKREIISNGTVKDKATQIKNRVIPVKSISKGVTKVDRIETKSENIPNLNRHKILGRVGEVVDTKTVGDFLGARLDLLSVIMFLPAEKARLETTEDA